MKTLVVPDIASQNDKNVKNIIVQSLSMKIYK